MRLCCTAVALCLLAGYASAQSGLRSASLPDRTSTQPIPPPRADQFLARPRTYAPRFDRPARPRRQHGLPLGYGYFGDVYAPPDSRYPAENMPNGFLHLELEPRNAQVHIDGFYVGTVDDFRRVIPGRSVEAGPHRVELRASGYQTAAFDVLILPNETITYRADLEARAVSAAPAVAPRAVPKTFYVIPGCYAGDKPPRAARLRRGCDASKIRAIPPAVSTVARVRR
jgi:hypothetical protein